MAEEGERKAALETVRERGRRAEGDGAGVGSARPAGAEALLSPGSGSRGLPGASRAGLSGRPSTGGGRGAARRWRRDKSRQ